jgi:hypothetical protein
LCGDGGVAGVEVRSGRVGHGQRPVGQVGPGRAQREPDVAEVGGDLPRPGGRVDAVGEIEGAEVDAP